MEGYEKALIKAIIKKVILWLTLLIILGVQLAFWTCFRKVVVVRPLDSGAGIWKTFLLVREMLYVLLQPIPELIYVISSCIKRSGKKSWPGIPLPKTENKDLMGFYRKEYTVPWTIYYTQAGICLFLLDRKYLMTLLLCLWALLQILESEYFAGDELLARKKRLRKDVLGLHQKEKKLAHKFLHYALIMADDSGLIPSTFGNGSRLTSNVLLFDKATEVDPFLAEDPEKNFKENWESLYVQSDFFIYAFDSEKCTAEELEQKWISAVISCRFPVSKPLYLLIRGSSPALDMLIRKYSWLPEVSVRSFGSWDELQIQDVIEDYMDSRRIPSYMGKDPEAEVDYAQSIGYPAEELCSAAMFEYMFFSKSGLIFAMANDSIGPKYDYRNYISSCCFLLRTSLEDIACRDLGYFYHYLNSQIKSTLPAFPEGYRNFCFCARNFFVCGFFPNIFRWKEISIAIMAEFEYANMAMRFVHYYLYCKRDPGPIEEYFRKDKELGEGIWELAQPEDMFYMSLHQKVGVSNPLLHNALFILKGLFGIEHREETLDFLHLANILRICRNITRAHGVISESLRDQLWFAVYVLLHLLNVMLSVSKMEIELKDDFVNVSYEEDVKWYRNRQYAVIEDDTPLLLHGISGKNRYEYINYYKGSAAIPEITERIQDNV